MMRVLRTLFLVLVLQSLTLGAQITFVGTDPAYLRTRSPLPSDARAVRPPSTVVRDLKALPKHTIIVPSARGSFEITAETFEIFTDDAVMINRTARGDEYADIPSHALVRGTIAGYPGSTVFLAAFETHVIGVLEILEPEGKRRFLISPDTVIAGRMANHVVYEVRPGDGTPTQCRAEELPSYQRQVDSIFAITARDESAKGAHDAPQDATQYSLQLALDCTNSFYKNLGSNLTTAASSAIAIAGASGAVYFRDANVLIRVPYLRVWTVTDPYPGDIGAKLGKIREHWEGNMKHVRRSVTCLLSGEGGGGLAWVGVLCGGYGYNVSGVDGRVNFPATGYIWDIDVSSHELGHNIGSSHTHNCGWNPPIDSCWNAEGGCYENTRARRGTIMSYCHLTNKGTELQFHPRVATLFNRVLSTTWCNAPVPTRKDSDVAVVSINVPLNGAECVAKKTFQPSAYIRNLGDKTLTNIAVVCEITDLDNNVKKTLNVAIQQLATLQTQLAQFPGVSIDTSGSYLVRITAKAQNDQYPTNDIMTRPFAVVAADSGSIQVTTPNGGEKLTAGTTVDVTITAVKVKNALLQYSIDNGASWTTLQYSVDAAKETATVKWQVPFVVSTQCLVRAMSLTNASIVDVSNAVFSIDVPLDVQAYDIVEPLTKDNQTSPLVPKIVVRNIGSNDAKDVKVRFSMKWVRATAPCYDTSFVLPLVKARGEDTITLAQTPVLADGVHTMEFYVDAPNDTNSANDRFWREFSAKGLTPPSDVRYEEGPNRVLLQWRIRSSDPTQRVELWRGTSPATMQKIRTFRETINTYVDDGLYNEGNYVYALRVVKGNLQSVFTPLIYATPFSFPGASAPATPELISPVDGTTGVPALADLVWTSVNGGDQYEIQVATDNAFQDLEYVAVVRDPGALVLPLEFNSTHRWRVRAMNQTVTGVFTKPATFITTKNCAGKALTFNGNGNKATDATFAWNGGPVTVEYWTYVKRSTLKASTTFMVGESDNAGNRFQSHCPWDDGRIYWDYGNINEKGRISAPLGDANFDRWVHVALVSDGQGFKAIYINGEEAASAKEASTTTALKELTIGGMRSNTWFNGMVDEFRVWTEARTLEEIRTNMNRRTPQAGETSKIAGWWRLDEGSGITSKDAVRQRQLSLTSGSMWVESEALVSCEDPIDLQAPSIISGTGIVPAIRTHAIDVSWKPVVQSRGATWYEMRLLDSATSSIIKRVNNIPANGAKDLVYSLRGLPADSTMRLQIRTRNTYGVSDWTSSTLTTRTPCPTSMVTFSGIANRFTSETFLYHGKATTVEYWSFIAPEQLMNSVSFSVGEKADDARRLQAHAPWGDKTLYWDYGDWRESGRVSTSYESRLGTWAHVALVSNGYDSMAIYLDGKLAKRSTFTDSPRLLKQLTLGGNPHSQTWFKGNMRNFRIWNTMRSEKQIAESMFDHIVDPQPNLLRTYFMDEGRGLRVNDAFSTAGFAKSDIEPTWGAGPASNIMQPPAVVFGRRIVQRGETAQYSIKNVLDASHTWQVIGGKIIEGQNTSDDVVIAWNQSDSVGSIIVKRTFQGGCEDETRVDITLPVFVGVSNELDETAQVWFSPNPATDVLTIRSESAGSVSILDVQGRVVLTVDIAQGATSLPIDMLAQGSYIVRLSSADVVRSSRLSVQR